LWIVTAFFFPLFLNMAKNKCFFGCCFLVAIFRQILLKSHPDLFYFIFYKFRWWCGLCKMDILVIVTVTISKSFQIIIRHWSNFNLKLFLVVYLAPFQCFCLYFVIFFTPSQYAFFFGVYLYFVMNLFNEFHWHFAKTAKKTLMEQNDIKWNL
jgi:hypothetical protein